MGTHATCAFLHSTTTQPLSLLFTVYPSLSRQSPTLISVLRLDSTLRDPCSMIRMMSPESCPHRTYAFSWVLGLQAPKPDVVIFQEAWALYTNSDFYCVVAHLIPCVLFTRHFTSDKSAFLASITRGLLYSQCRGNGNPNSPSSLVTGTLNTNPTLGVNRC